MIIDFASVASVCVKHVVCSVYSFEQHHENINFFSVCQVIILEFKSCGNNK